MCTTYAILLVCLKALGFQDVVTCYPLTEILQTFLPIQTRISMLFNSTSCVIGLVVYHTDSNSWKAAGNDIWRILSSLFFLFSANIAYNID